MIQKPYKLMCVRPTDVKSSTKAIKGPTCLSLSQLLIPPALSERAAGSSLWAPGEVEIIDERTTEKNGLVESQVEQSHPGQLPAPVRDQQLQNKSPHHHHYASEITNYHIKQHMRPHSEHLVSMLKVKHVKHRETEVQL